MFEGEHVGVRKWGAGRVLSKTSQGRQALGFCPGNEHPPTLAPILLRQRRQLPCSHVLFSGTLGHCLLGTWLLDQTAT